jgi:NADPH:quinone reductase-like Zn-dependent oxidoreductase
LKLEQHPDLTPTDNEILVDVEAIGVNYADCVTRMGLYTSAKHYVGYPITPGFEVAGRIAAVGKNAGNCKVGDRVLAVTRFNGYASQVVVPAHQVFQLPANLSTEAAAGLPTAFLTAWYAVFVQARPESGASVLVHSAAGGVGGALVQLCKLAGCRVIAVVGAPHKIDTAMAMGADTVIDKSAEDLWAKTEMLAPDGFSAIFDANGVATLRQSYEHLAPTGRLVIYGFHSMLPLSRNGGRGRPNWLKLAWAWVRTPRFNPLRLTTENRSVLGFNLSYLFDKTEVLEHAMDQLLQWIGQGKIRPLPITRVPFSRTADAHRALESGQTQGKIVLIVDTTEHKPDQSIPVVEPESGGV